MVGLDLEKELHTVLVLGNPRKVRAWKKSARIRAQDWLDPHVARDNQVQEPGYRDRLVAGGLPHRTLPPRLHPASGGGVRDRLIVSGLHAAHWVEIGTLVFRGSLYDVVVVGIRGRAFTEFVSTIENSHLLLTGFPHFIFRRDYHRDYSPYNYL